MSIKKLLVTGPLRPAPDTTDIPFWVGEIRQLVQGDSAQIFVGVSKTAAKKWYKIGALGTGTISSTSGDTLFIGSDTLLLTKSFADITGDAFDNTNLYAYFYNRGLPKYATTGDLATVNVTVSDKVIVPSVGVLEWSATGPADGVTYFAGLGGFWKVILPVGGSSGSTLVIENGATSSELDSLATSPNDSTLSIKSIGTIGSTFINVTKTVGSDSVKNTVRLDTASAALKAYIVSNTPLSILPDVDLLTTPPSEGDYLRYDTSGNKWRNHAPVNVYPARSGDSIYIVSGVDSSSGVYAPTSISGGTPGGSDTQVQFNDGGSFGGDAGLTYNKITNTITTDSILSVSYRAGSAPPSAEKALFSGKTASVSASEYAFRFWDNANNSLMSLTASGVLSIPGIFSALSSTTIRLAGASATWSASNLGGTSTPIHTFTALSSTTASGGLMRISGTFAPSAGAGDYFGVQINHTINQTGTATGIVRGIHINPTLTSVLGEYRSIDIESGKAYMRSIKLKTSGDKLEIATGSNASTGQATLVGGTVTVSTTAVTTSSLIYLTVATPGGTQGFLSIGTITNGTSFVINSTSGSETSVINWWIIN